MKYTLLLFLLFFSMLVFSQENEGDDLEIDEIIDNVISIDENDLIDILEALNKYQILFTSVDFNNKTYFLGRDLGLDQFNMSAQLMYESSNGIFIGISGNYYDKFDPKWDLTVLTAGYGKGFGQNETLRAELGYSRYLFSDPSSNDFDNSLDLSLHVSTKNDVLGATLNTSYLFGKKTGFQSSLSLYGDIRLVDLNKKKGAKITFGPDLSFIFGSENIDTSRIDNLGLDFPRIDLIVGSFEKFALRNVQLQLPVVFEFTNFHIEAGYNINFPSAFDFERRAPDTTSFFNLGLSYIFTLN